MAGSQCLIQCSHIHKFIILLWTFLERLFYNKMQYLSPRKLAVKQYTEIVHCVFSTLIQVATLMAQIKPRSYARHYII